MSFSSTRLPQALDDGAGTPARPRCRPRLLVTLLVVLATLAVFSPALTADFVAWDDDVNFLRNAHYRGLTARHLGWMATATVMGHYIPLTWLTLGLDYTLWGMDARGYHFTNLVLHTAAVVAFLALALRLLRLGTSLGDGPRLLGAGAAALFFAVHPLRAESVAWITERRDVLSGVFFLLTVLAYLAAQDASGRRRRLLLGASVAAYVAAALSKSIVMTLPLVLLVLDVYPLRRLQLVGGRLPSSARRVLLEKAPYLVIALACAATSYHVVKTFTVLTPLETFTWSGRVAMVFYTLWFYVTRTLVPVALSPLYELPPALSVWEPRFLLVALAVTAVTVALVALRRRWPAALTAWVCYAIILAPVSGVVHAGLQLAHDRYSYLSCLGWAVLIGAGVGALADGRGRAIRAPVRRAALAACAVWLVGLGWLGFQQTRVWQDTDTLWRHAVEVGPACSVCHANLAAHLVNQDDVGGALRHGQLAIRLRPDRPRAYATVGQALVKGNRPADAIPYFERFVRAMPESADVSGLGLALIRAGRPADALAPLERALALDPSNVVARVNYAGALVALGRREAAMEQYARALARDPVSSAAHYGRGWALVHFGDVEGGRRAHVVLKSLDAPLAAQLAHHLAAAPERPR